MNEVISQSTRTRKIISKFNAWFELLSSQLLILGRIFFIIGNDVKVNWKYKKDVTVVYVSCEPLSISFTPCSFSSFLSLSVFFVLCLFFIPLHLSPDATDILWWYGNRVLEAHPRRLCANIVRKYRVNLEGRHIAWMILSNM